MKRQYLNVQLDTLLANYKKAVLAYFEAKIIQAQKDLKMQILKIQEGHIKFDRNVRVPNEMYLLRKKKFKRSI